MKMILAALQRLIYIRLRLAFELQLGTEPL